MRLLLALLVLASCDDTDDLTPETPEGATTTLPFRPSGPVSDQAPMRIRHHKVRSLVDEASRLELRGPGVSIDLGAPDQHKYLPPVQSGRIVRADPEESTLEVSGSISMDVQLLDEQVAQIIIRARVGRRDVLTLFVDGKPVGSGRVDDEWKELRYDLPAPIVGGMHEIRLVARTGHRFVVDWLYLRDQKVAGPWVPPLDRVEVRDHGGVRTALVADPPRSWVLHTVIPSEAVLLFEYAGAGVTFEVFLTSDAAPKERLFSKVATDSYQGALVDLAAHAGELVRLELVTRGTGLASWGDPWIARTGRPPLRDNTTGAPRGAIVVVIDTLRQDRVRVFNPKTLVTTPALDALATESRVFENAYTTAPWTKPSVTSILTGLHPTTHGAQSEEAKLSNSLVLISETLGARGFSTALFSANGYVSEFFGFTQGWDEFLNFPRKKLRTQADNVYDTALKWLKGRGKDEPFLLYVQSIDPHVPYQTPGTYMRPYYSGSYTGALGDAVSGNELNEFNEGKLELSEDDRTFLIASYHAEISYHDHYFGRFIADLKEIGLLDDVILVVTNDHGEELFDHGKLDHGQSLHEELIRAPLIVRYPARFKPGRQTEPVSLVDVAPTVLDALGVAPLDHHQGVSLLSARRRLYVTSTRGTTERAIRMGPYKMIETLGVGRTLFDLRTDPRELRDVAVKRPIARRTLEQHLFEGLQIPRELSRPDGMNRARRHQTARARLDRAMLEHLKALGYFND